MGFRSRGTRVLRESVVGLRRILRVVVVHQKAAQGLGLG